MEKKVAPNPSKIDRKLASLQVQQGEERLA